MSLIRKLKRGALCARVGRSIRAARRELTVITDPALQLEFAPLLADLDTLHERVMRCIPGPDYDKSS
jgi:hypothetical protein